LIQRPGVIARQQVGPGLIQMRDGRHGIDAPNRLTPPSALSWSGWRARPTCGSEAATGHQRSKNTQPASNAIDVAQTVPLSERGDATPASPFASRPTAETPRKERRLYWAVEATRCLEPASAWFYANYTEN
jgi:hypothetical protein